ncbi:MAG: hypothetical protein DMD82_09785 [Candidatus Rokuibacteriota bacterium]|nr:MAG: hypothetical protein DMD82_09785 [Candidatus Rokubacteria bacterium]
MLLFIVSRESSKRFEYLARVFAKEETVQVILDRRVTERRARQTSGDGSQRRRGNRRSRPHLDRELQTLGWALIR